MPANKKHNVSPRPDKLSRNGIELFRECPRCFFLSSKFGVRRPSGFPFLLNDAFDWLMKKEFDRYRAEQRAHPLMLQAGINAVPYLHPALGTWRLNQKGLQFFHTTSRFLVAGAIDDAWVSPDGIISVVDYKATSTSKEILVESASKAVFRRQLDVYHWLFRMNGFTVSNTAYLVYGNALRNRPALDGRLDFEIRILPYECDDAWIEPILGAVRDCINCPVPPAAGPECKYCAYRAGASLYEEKETIL